jgi:energy-coupling factor transporter ATP-binding protein EcfA2
MENQYVIDKIEAENYRIFESLNLQIRGNNLHVVGMPDGGKTTLISLLWEIVQTASDPIKKGQGKAKLRVILKDPINGKKVFAERTITAKTSTIKITTDDGTKITAAAFKKWFESLAKNPQDIADMKPLARLEALQECVNFQEGVDINDINSRLKDARELRTQKNTTKDFAEKQVGAEPDQVKEIDILELSNQYNAAEEANSVILATKTNVSSASEAVMKLKLELEKQEKFIVDSDAWLATQELVGTTEMATQLDNAKETNAKAAEYVSWETRKETSDEAYRDWFGANESVQDITEEKRVAIEAAGMPLPGLDFGDGDVLYNGLPLEQSGNSVISLVCCALVANKVAKAVLKVVRMDRTEHMSVDHKAQAVKAFNDRGIQVLSSRVHRNVADVEVDEVLITEGILVCQ